MSTPRPHTDDAASAKDPSAGIGPIADNADPSAMTREELDAAAAEASAIATRAARIQAFSARRDRVELGSRLVSRARVATFALAVAAFVWAEIGGPGPAGLGAPLGIVMAATFIGLVAVHARVRRRLRWYEQLVRVNEEAIRRIRREWDALAQIPPGTAPEAHPYADDLDIVGHASLFQLLGSVGTAPGRSTLLEWLFAPAPPDEIRERAEAVRELAADVEFRDVLAATRRTHETATADDVRRFLEWAEGEPWLIRRPWLVWGVRLLLPPTTLLFLALHFSIGVPAVFGVIGLLIQAGIGAIYGRHAFQTFAKAFSREDFFRSDARLFGLLTGQPFHSPLLKTLQAELTVEGQSAAVCMRKLARLLYLAEVRYSMAHFPLQVLLLWDLQVLERLERWQQAHGRRVRRWIEALGRFDALSALGTLAADHPTWTFPEIDIDGPPRIEARGLAHPLLRPSVARVNDVEIGPPGTFLLVTGSNMSGKSTLLRAIGVNVVLAQAGGPVCARSMRLTPLTVFTCMRVQDSLEEGVSFFMAELRRLKQIVDAARASRGGERTLLYLLDEILQGTNTAERQIAARRILSHLVAEGAIGAVTTHDLSLTRAEELVDHARLVHFRETIERRDGRMHMSFDYRLRPGPATSTNALALMELMGLD